MEPRGRGVKVKGTTSICQRSAPKGQGLEMRTSRLVSRLLRLRDGFLISIGISKHMHDLLRDKAWPRDVASNGTKTDILPRKSQQEDGG